jgi:hypothetical protein
MILEVAAPSGALLEPHPTSASVSATVAPRARPAATLRAHI